ncbi:hypothetical protein [Pedobacter boryungensis]|uniref:Beta-lactamase-inhibitor-like PepSY-like domain-containing protein n=1 Tax=Pedobacter boryungensis TaxID=869962 RepID=A0ABX2DB65_9SPHI|nr:hypothetical protein [Pedobacter boryungensis]NQX31289.1 hypothetical protein [Pedobacter boryungensis]
MKKILIVMVMLGFLASASYAQKLNASKVPAAVKTAFAKAHASTKVNWSKEEVNYEAEFTLNGKETSEVYTAAGVLTETEVEIKVSEFPDAVKMKLKGMKVTEAAKITKADGSIVYEAEVKGKDLLFDAKGNSVKK